MSKRPQIWVFCGPNGAGKSTLAERYLRDKLQNVNPDVIAQALPRRIDGSLAELEAGRIALRERRRCIDAGESFAFETTLSGNSEIASLRAAKAAGYKVNVVFVGLEDAETSVARVADRVGSGGHDVPHDAIHRRYERVMLNLAEAAQVGTGSSSSTTAGRPTDSYSYKRMGAFDTTHHFQSGRGNGCPHTTNRKEQGT